MARLPQELFDAIIDEIHDQETLKACALVATSFLRPSRRKLFRKVRLGEVGRRSRDIAPALAESPHLMSYIRDLSIHLWGTSSEYLAVAVILRSAQNIESLVVFGKAINWDRLEHEVASALLDCLSRPLSATTRSKIHGGYPSKLHASAPAPRLRHLILDAGFEVRPICDFLLHPRNPAYTQQIERLEIHINQPNASHFERIMAACAATLKYLAVYATNLIRLPLLPFVLEVEIKVSVSNNRRLPAFFSHNFSQIASSLPVVFMDPLRPGPEIEWPDEAPLPIFGPSFMDRTQLLHLRRVHCILRRQSASGDLSAVFDRFAPAMESKMPGLRGRGILRCAKVFLNNSPATIFSFKWAQSYTSDAQFRKHSIIDQRLSGLSFTLWTSFLWKWGG
ncbi:hypothetical protein B0H14DRAFT_3712954 [Mycena olivaceomarginata]|nr:hypothetical protein B0H14DRAFT_3712954 [Mycena olivaceomarginata]